MWGHSFEILRRSGRGSAGAIWVRNLSVDLVLWDLVMDHSMNSSRVRYYDGHGVNLKLMGRILSVFGDSHSNNEKPARDDCDL